MQITITSGLDCGIKVEFEEKHRDRVKTNHRNCLWKGRKDRQNKEVFKYLTLSQTSPGFYVSAVQVF